MRSNLSVPQRAAVLIPLALYPLAYYRVGFEALYRESLDGLALLPAVTGRSGRLRPRMTVEAPSVSHSDRLSARFSAAPGVPGPG